MRKEIWKGCQYCGGFECGDFPDIIYIEEKKTMPDLLIQEHEIDDFIDDLTNSIQEGVVPEVEVTHLRGEMFENVFEDIVIPSDDLKDVIREVIERWIEEGLALT